MNGQSDAKTPSFFEPALSSLAPGADAVVVLAVCLAMCGPYVFTVSSMLSCCFLAILARRVKKPRAKCPEDRAI
jgi:hypothetical protein